MAQADTATKNRALTEIAAGLYLKSGNAAILRDGSEAIHSNQAIAAYVHAGLRAAGAFRRAGFEVIEAPTAFTTSLRSNCSHSSARRSFARHQNFYA